MKRNLIIIITAVFIISSLLFPSMIFADKQDGGTRIQDGTILYSEGHYLAGQPITVGFDIFGYNYQSHIFKGSYANAYLGSVGFPPYLGDDASYLSENPKAAAHWAWPYRNVTLEMKWNDAWISNRDCDGDGKLDRHYGFPSYIGSGAWETNHMWGKNDDGTNWNYFVKIVAAPADAVLTNGIWYSPKGVELGYVIWGEFMVIQEVSNDPATGDHGLIFNAEGPNGFGCY